MPSNRQEVVRQIYAHTDPDLAAEFVERLGHDLGDDSCPLEVRSLGPQPDMPTPIAWPNHRVW